MLMRRDGGACGAMPPARRGAAPAAMRLSGVLDGGERFRWRCAQTMLSRGADELFLCYIHDAAIIFARAMLRAFTRDFMIVAMHKSARVMTPRAVMRAR